MPRMRKLSEGEIWHLEADENATQRAEDAAARLADQDDQFEPRPGRFIRSTPPIVGDIVDIGNRNQGIVLSIRRARDGSWDYAEILVNSKRRWIRAEQVGSVSGRPAGISRIDHPRKRTYGWYARVYKGKETRVSRFFSDLKYGGRAAALAAALTYHEDARNNDFST